MAVTVTDRRTTVIAAENTTNWSGAGYGTTSTSAEGTNAVAESLASTTGQTYYTQPTGSVNLGTSPGTLVYIWSFNNALQDAWDASPPPNALLLGDGTDRIGFDMAGADRRVFNHLQGPTGLDVNGWQCLVLDTGQASAMNSAGNTYVVAGSFAGLNFAAITQWGVSFNTNSKALGGGYNVAVDIIRHGNDGIRVTGGGSGTQGNFSEIAIEDRSRTAGKAHGILRELTTGVYGCQGPLTFGDSGAATTNYFEDSGVVLAFENRNISDGKYYLNVEGNGTGTNSFVLTGSTISTGGPTVKMDLSGGNLNVLTLNTVVFASLGGVILFSANADASGHTVNDCTFEACDKITVGAVDFRNNTISNSVATDYAATSTDGADMRGCVFSGFEGTAGNSALEYDINADPDGELDNCSFTKGTAATHAIEFGDTIPSEITLRGIDFSGYNASDSANDSTLYFADTTGTITVNLIGCTGNISIKTAGCTVNKVIDPVTTEITVKDIDTDAAIENARVLLLASDGTGVLPYLDSVTSVARSGSTATVTTPAAHGLVVGDFAQITGANEDEYNGAFEVLTVPTTTTFTYTVPGTPDTPATGTIKLTGGYFNSLTNASGVVTDTRSIASAQPFVGRVRKYSNFGVDIGALEFEYAGPYYKTQPFSGTVSTTSGFTANISLIRDG